MARACHQFWNFDFLNESKIKIYFSVIFFWYRPELTNILYIEHLLLSLKHIQPQRVVLPKTKSVGLLYTYVCMYVFSFLSLDKFVDKYNWFF